MRVKPRGVSHHRAPCAPTIARVCAPGLAIAIGAPVASWPLGFSKRITVLVGAVATTRKRTIVGVGAAPGMPAPTISTITLPGSGGGGPDTGAPGGVGVGAPLASASTFGSYDNSTVAVRG